LLVRTPDIAAESSSEGDIQIAHRCTARAARYERKIRPRARRDLDSEHVTREAVDEPKKVLSTTVPLFAGNTARTLLGR